MYCNKLKCQKSHLTTDFYLYSQAAQCQKWLQGANEACITILLEIFCWSYWNLPNGFKVEI